MVSLLSFEWLRVWNSVISLYRRDLSHGELNLAVFKHKVEWNSVALKSLDSEKLGGKKDNKWHKATLCDRMWQNKEGALENRRCALGKWRKALQYKDLLRFFKSLGMCKKLLENVQQMATCSKVLSVGNLYIVHELYKGLEGEISTLWYKADLGKRLWETIFKDKRRVKEINNERYYSGRRSWNQTLSANNGNK